MSPQLLIYETAVPVSQARHGKCSVETGNTYAFSQKVNSVPLMAVEFPQAAPEYAIVFTGNGEDIAPVVILGARQQENLYLGAEGKWQAQYIPAFVRRYPFVFATSKDGKTHNLCVDEAFTGVNFQGRGVALFDEDGKPSTYTENVMKFLQNYGEQAQRSKAFCQLLRTNDLLDPMQAEFTSTAGEKTALKGFLVVNRAKLKALSGDVLAELVKTDTLELIYLHLQSLRNFTSVKDRLGLTQAEVIV